MLWKFGFSSSNFDQLLTRSPPASVEELLDEPDILSEAKAQNAKLISYLSREDAIKSLLTWVTSGLDELDSEAAEADLLSYQHAQAKITVPGPAPGSPPLTPMEVPTGPEDENAESKQRFWGGFGQEMMNQQQEAGEQQKHRVKYPLTATEILTSDLWVITETAVGHADTLLGPFWDTVLPPLDESGDTLEEADEKERARDEFWSEEDEERDRRREIIKGNWVRVNGWFLAKKPEDMMRFIRGIPNIIERIVARIESPAIQDILIRIVSTEEAGVHGVVEWLSSQRLIPRLLELLSPKRSPAIQAVVADLIKTIINICAPTPFNPNGGNLAEQTGGPGQTQQNSQQGVRDNRLVRELVSEQSISTLIGFMLDQAPLSDEAGTQDKAASEKGSLVDVDMDAEGDTHPEGETSTETASKDEPASVYDPHVVYPLPSVLSATSSLCNITLIVIELIRRNNSDYSEPHLFHTLRNRLMSVGMQQQQKQQQEQQDRDARNANGANEDEPSTEAVETKQRESMEEAMEEISGQMGIVHLGHLLTGLSAKIEGLQTLIREPRSIVRSATSLNPNPLTLERFRIVELYAELLHCSNMSILNRPPGTGPIYNDQGVLTGGLDALEKLGDVIDNDQNADDKEGGMGVEGELSEARELPVSSASTDCSLDESDEVDSADENILEDDESGPMDITPTSSMIDFSRPDTAASDIPPPPPPSQADVARLRDVMGQETGHDGEQGTSDLASVSRAAVAATTAPPSVMSDAGRPEGEGTPGTTQTADTDDLAPGDKLKQVYIKHGVVESMISLFFEHPSNNFLHHAVFDFIQQIFNGRIGPGFNRELVIVLFNDGRLISRILDAQRVNDSLVSRPKTPRLALMGHVILIAEEVCKFLERCPPELLSTIEGSFVQSEWQAFIDGPFSEAKMRDNQPLAGGKPMQPVPSAADTSKSDSDDDEDVSEAAAKIGEPLTRTSASEPFSRGFGFGSPHDDDDSGSDNEQGVFSQYLAQQMSSGVGRNMESSDDDDTDEDDGEWQEGRYSNAGPHGPTRRRSTSGFDDEFAPSAGQPGGFGGGDGDDAWGDFTSAPDNSTGEDPFEDSFSPSNLNLGGSSLLTPVDWAEEEFNREFQSTVGARAGDDDDDAGGPSIVVPDLSFEEEDQSTPTPTSSWSLAGGDDDGEDLPPAHSPTFEEITKLPSTLPAASRHQGSGLAHPAAQMARFGEAISPPDPALIAAATEDEPLGPGVSGDTHIRGGMLERRMDDGEIVQVPQDEVVRGVEDAMERRTESGSETETGDP